VELITSTYPALSISTALAVLVFALAKLDEGSYGRCDECGRVIPEERLEAVPWTPYCVACSERRRPG
jgi:DnaK suppressor protein